MSFCEGGTALALRHNLIAVPVAIAGLAPLIAAAVVLRKVPRKGLSSMITCEFIVGAQPAKPL